MLNVQKSGFVPRNGHQQSAQWFYWLTLLIHIEILPLSSHSMIYTGGNSFYSALFLLSICKYSAQTYYLYR